MFYTRGNQSRGACLVHGRSAGQHLLPRYGVYNSPMTEPTQEQKQLKQLVNEAPSYTAPKEFENATLFLRLGLPCTLIRHENGAFRKRAHLKTPALRFSYGGKKFTNETFDGSLFENNDVKLIR